MHPHAHQDHAGHAHHKPPSAPNDAALKDPVCGMAVTEQSEHHAEHEGRPYYFCSAKCQAKFVAEPARYSAGSGAQAGADVAQQPVGTVYTCPMHPEIRQAHPRNCPKCGMALGAKARLQVLGKGKPAPP